MEVEGTELVLGDEIRAFEGAYGWVTVVKVDEDTVTVFRPYVHVGNFSYTGGVLHYLGSETFTLARKGPFYIVDASNHRDRVGKGVIA